MSQKAKINALRGTSPESSALTVSVKGGTMTNPCEDRAGWSTPDMLNDTRAVMGAMLKKAREDLKLTQQEVAERLGCNRYHVAGIERGQQRISITTLFRYAAACGKKLTISLE